MRTLEFEVNQQKLRKQPGCDFSGIVAGTSGYLRAKFHFSEEWKDCKKVASFFDTENNEFCVLLDNNDSCDIHEDALNGLYFEVAVTGANKSGGTTIKLTTNKMKVKQEVR